MNRDILVVDIKYMNVYDFLRDGETETELLERAKEAQQKDIELWSGHCEKYPDTETFRVYLKAAKEKEYQIMTWDEFEKTQRDFYISKPLIEVTEERFHKMLNVLPPKCWTTIQGVEMFCMSEMLTGSYTDQYARVGDKYYAKTVDMLDRSTWIHNYIGELV